MNKPSPAVRTFILNNRDMFSNVSFFCTHGGSGGEKTFRELEKLCEKKPKGTLEIHEDEIGRNISDDKIKRFVNKIV